MFGKSTLIQEEALRSVKIDGKKKNRGIVWNEFEEEFNKSYYRQLMAEDNLLSALEKNMNPAASDVIDDISKAIETGRYRLTQQSSKRQRNCI
jgi:hypothetical protein